MERPTSSLVEEAVAAIRNGEATLEECALRYGLVWPAIEAEVRLALKLVEAGAFFKTELPNLKVEQLWSRIETEITASLPPQAADSGHAADLKPVEDTVPLAIKTFRPGIKTRPAPVVAWWRHKPLQWAAAVLIVFTLSFSTVAGVAQASEPGDAFYGVKLWLDGAGEFFAGSNTEKASAALVYADHRLQEMEGLAARGRTQHLDLAVDAYRRSLNNLWGYTNRQLSPGQSSTLENQRQRLTSLENKLSNPETNQVSAPSIKELEQVLVEIEQTPPSTPEQAAPLPPEGEANPANAPTTPATFTAVTTVPTVTTVPATMPVIKIELPPFPAVPETTTPAATNSPSTGPEDEKDPADKDSKPKKDDQPPATKPGNNGGSNQSGPNNSNSGQNKKPDPPANPNPPRATEGPKAPDNDQDKGREKNNTQPSNPPKPKK